jgi:hypothetical protein
MHTIPSAESDAWNLAEGSRDGRPSMVRYRPSLAPFVGDARYPRRLTFSWKYEVSEKSGLPSDAQSDEMRVFEDSLVASFDPERVAILAFVFTHAGVREWHYYVGQVDDLGDRVNAALSYSSTRLPIEIAIEDDAAWEEMSRVLSQCK